MESNEDIVYLARLKDDIEDDVFFDTELYRMNGLCGKIVNQTGTNLYFELVPSRALVIIPHCWIKWLAPSKEPEEQDTKDESVNSALWVENE